MKRILLMTGIALAGLLVRAETGNIQYSGTMLGTSRADATVIATGVDLADYTPKCTFLSNSTERISGPLGTAWTAFIKTVDDGAGDELSAQFQIYWKDRTSGWLYTSALIVRFFQDGNDIRAYLKDAFCSTCFAYLLDKDLESLFAGGDARVSRKPLATASQTGYGVTHLLLKKNVVNQTVQSDYGTLTNGFAVAAGNRLVLDDYAAFEYAVPSNTVAKPVTVDGELLFNNFRGTFSTVTNGGDIRVETDQAHVEKVVFPDYLPFDKSWASASKKIVARNKKIADIESISGQIYYTSDNKHVAFTGYPDPRNAPVRWQLQGEFYPTNPELGRIIGTTAVFFEENNSEILKILLVTTHRSFYYKNTTNERIVQYCGGIFLGMDMFEPNLTESMGDFMGVTAYDPNNWGQGTSSGKYGFHDVTITFKDGTSTTVDLSGTLAMTAGSEIQATGVAANPAKVNVKLSNANTRCCRVVAGANSDVTINCKDFTVYDKQLDIPEWVVNTGGILRTEGNTATMKLPPIRVDGGTLQIAQHRTEAGMDTLSYLNRLVLSDGAVVTSAVPSRAGLVYDQVTSVVWQVTGAAPSFINCDVQWRASAGYSDARRFALVVDDVNGKDDADLVVNGAFSSGGYTENKWFNKAHLVKLGAGTLCMNGQLSMRYPTLIGEGTFLINKSNLLGLDEELSLRQGFALEGGTLAVAAGTTNEAGTLAVNAKTGKIVLGEGASLSFEKSSDVAWTADAEIEIVGSLKTSRLRFGTGSNGLTLAQKRCLLYKGERISLDANGYVQERTGMTIILR